MSSKAFVQSMKTIAESLIRKAGFDKTRSGKVVGVNSLTNTYSVKVDGYTYNNVRVVNDATYNVGDTVKVNMPVNQPSQLYISGSIFSDSSIGKKIGHAESLIEAADREISDIIEIMGNIYQLSIRSEYTSTSVTHYGVMMQNGEDVTAPEYTQNFYWYLEKPTGKELQGTGASLTLSTSEFLYGQAILLEWIVDNTVKLRAHVTLFDNSKVTEINTRVSQAIEIAMNEQQYYWFTDEGTDTGAHISFLPKDTFESHPSGGNLLANARGVAVRHGLEELVGMQVDPNNTNNASVYFNGYVDNTWQKIAEYKASGIWFHDSIPYTIGNNNSYVKYEYDSNAGKYKINISADSITLGNQNVTSWEQLGSPYLTEITNGGLFVHRADSGYNATNPSSAQAYGIKIASNMEFIQAGKALATYGDTITFRNTSGYTMMQLSAGSLAFYRGTSSSNYALATFGTGSITLKNTSGVNTFVAQQSGMTLYNGSTTTNVALASFSASGITLKNNNDYKLFTAGANSMIMYDGTSYERALASFGSGGMTLRNTSGYTTCVISASAFTLRSGNSSDVALFYAGAGSVYMNNASGTRLLTISTTGMTINKIVDSSAYNAAVFNSSGMTLYSYDSTNNVNRTAATFNLSGATIYSNGSAQASFASNQINLGNSSTAAKISMCGSSYYLYGQNEDPWGDSTSARYLYFGIDSTATYRGVILSTASQASAKNFVYGSSKNKGCYLDLSHYNAYISLDAYYSSSKYTYLSLDGNSHSAQMGTKNAILDITNGKVGFTVASGSSGNFNIVWGSTSMMEFAYASSASQVLHLQFPHSVQQSGSGKAAYLTDAGYLNRASSMRHMKRDIVHGAENFEKYCDPHQLYNVRVTQFKYRDGYLESGDYNIGRNIIGFIAEEVAEDFPMAAYHSNHGIPLDWQERIMIPALVQLVQEQHADIEALKDRVKELERMVA